MPVNYYEIYFQIKTRVCFKPTKLTDNEKRWTYTLAITFNYLPITHVTITDHYQQKPGREKITNELVLEGIWCWWMGHSHSFLNRIR